MVEYFLFKDMIISLAKKHSKNYDELVELISVGNLAFIKANINYNGNEKSRSAFFYRCIDNAIKDWKKGKYNYYKILQDINPILEKETNPLDNFPSHIDLEKRFLFMDSLRDLSLDTKCMVMDLFSCPEAFLNELTYMSKRYMRKAFKQLMISYGYDSKKISEAMIEIKYHLKEN